MLPRFEASSCAPALFTDAAPDLVYRFTPAVTGRYRVALDPAETDFDTQLYAAESCPPTLATCLGGADGPGLGGEALLLDLAGGEPVLLYVDGRGRFAPSSGKFLLTVGRVEADCGDTLDEDLDGHTDCADLDCAGAPSCFEGGDACADALSLPSVLPFTQPASTSLSAVGADLQARDCDPTRPADAAADRVYTFTAPADGRLGVWG